MLSTPTEVPDDSIGQKTDDDVIRDNTNTIINTKFCNAHNVCHSVSRQNRRRGNGCQWTSWSSSFYLAEYRRLGPLGA